MSENWEEDESHETSKARALLADGLHALIFLTRIPVKLPEGIDLPPLSRAARAFGLPGLVIGAGAGLIGGLAMGLGLPSLAAATLAVAGGILLGGAMQEDGFADVADGFWGGQTIARKLEIMRDSRMGAYGVLALGLLLILRVSLVSAVLDHGALSLILALAGAACLGRGLMVPMMAKLPSARKDGLSASAGQPTAQIARQAMIFASVSAAILFSLAGGILAAGLALGLGFAAAEGISRLARQHIGGQTGDVCGALSASVELASLAGLLMILGNS